MAEPAHEGEDTRRAVPASACGYPVEADAWGRALLEAGRQFRDELVELGHDVPGDEGTFDPILSDLQSELADE